MKYKINKMEEVLLYLLDKKYDYIYYLKPSNMLLCPQDKS